MTCHADWSLGSSGVGVYSRACVLDVCAMINDRDLDNVMTPAQIMLVLLYVY